jgi:hypothetical protein
MFKRILTTVVIFSVCSGLAAAHPSDGFDANPLPHVYATNGTGFTSNWCTGDLYFPAQFPTSESMSPAEKYIVSGSEGSAYGYGLRPWKSLIYNAVAAIYSQTGDIPEILDETALVSMSNGVLAPGDMRLDEFRSPVTGEFPRLDAKEFSAGDVYIRPLTLFEMDKYAALDPFYRELWYNDRVWNHNTQQYEQESLLGQVFYMRIYGDEDLLVAGLFFSAKPSSN